MDREAGDEMKRALLLLPALALLAGGVGLLGLGWVGSGRALHPPVPTYAWGLGDFPALAPEIVTFPSRTGVTLAGRFFPGRSRATVVLSHGYGGDQDEVLPAAAFLHDAGFSVFTYDLRGCGQSGGAVTFGALEQDDLASAIDYLVSRPDVDPARIGAFGYSMGGAATIMAAARDERVRAVVADSAWSDVDHWLRPRLGSSLRHPADRFSMQSLLLVEWRSGLDLGALKPAAMIGRISPRPILLIHGQADTVVPPGDGEQNFAAAGEPKEAWWMPGVGHNETLRPDDAQYAGRVVAFLQRALQP